MLCSGYRKDLSNLKRSSDIFQSSDEQLFVFEVLNNFNRGTHSGELGDLYLVYRSRFHRDNGLFDCHLYFLVIVLANSLLFRRTLPKDKPERQWLTAHRENYLVFRLGIHSFSKGIYRVSPWWKALRKVTGKRIRWYRSPIDFFDWQKT